MPSWAAFIRHHANTIRSVYSFLRSKIFRSASSPSSKGDSATTNSSCPKRSGSKMRLTLGSAVRDGKFMKIEKAWPLQSVNESEHPTARQHLEESTQVSMPWCKRYRFWASSFPVELSLIKGASNEARGIIQKALGKTVNWETSSSFGCSNMETFQGYFSVDTLAVSSKLESR